MMYDWLIVAILAYLFFASSSFFDKLVLAGKPKPKSYTFYVGAFSILVVLIIPFIKFSLPTGTGLIWIILDAMVHVAGLYTMFVALEKFEVSKVISTIGAAQPILIFLLTWLFWGPQAMPPMDIVAFFLLFIGSVVISIDKNIEVTGRYLEITLFSSLMFSLDYIFSKLVFLSFANHSFFSGIVWIRIFVLLFVLAFLIKKSSREEIFSKQVATDKKTQKIFLCAQLCGGAGNFLQSFAISLAPVAFLATINSLRGIQYAFLFIITLFISVVYPKILKEEVSKKIIFQKIISIAIIAIGLAILVSY